MSTSNYKSIINNNFVLSVKMLQTLVIKNKNTFFVKELLDRKLESYDNGYEVGSLNYIQNSNYYFIRARALQENSFLPNLDNETTITIRPQVFENYDLKEGDILISKDSNIGETVILDKDYPNHTICGALYRLPITKNKYYLLAFLKSEYFKNQLDTLVPKGSIIRHAKTLFLDCKIPFPTQKNDIEVIKLVEILTQSIINKEKEISRKHELINQLIEKELIENQKENNFIYKNTNFNEIKENSFNLNTFYYSENYKKTIFLIKNYNFGYEKILNNYDFSSGNTPQKYIENKNGSYFWISNSDINNLRLMNPQKINFNKELEKINFLNYGDILFSRRAPVGKPYIFLGQNFTHLANEGIKIFRTEKLNLNKNIFITCFLESKFAKTQYLVGGSIFGGISNEKIKDIIFPNFRENKQNEITELYYNSNVNLNFEILTLDNYLMLDNKFNTKAGIWNLDKSLKEIKQLLNSTIEKIINDSEVEIKFNPDKF